jgi:hypothetical protein
MYSEERSSLDQSVAVFYIADPFNAATVSLQLPSATSKAQQARIADLRRVLAALNGTLWDGTVIQQELWRYYQPLGLNAQIVAGPAGTNQVIINEGFRIFSIVLTAGDVQNQDAAKILWIVLSETDFLRAMKQPPEMGDKDVTVGFKADLEYTAGDEPYELEQRLQDQQLMLAQIGFTASLQPSTGMAGTQQYHDLRIQKATSNPKDDSKTPKPTPPATDPHGGVTTTVPITGRDSPQARQTGEVDKLDKPWFLGGGVVYRPGQGLGLLGNFARTRLPGNSSLSLAGAYPFGAARAANYSADYVGFDRIHQRITIQLTGSTDIDTHRFLRGEKLDQHQTGGFGQLVWEPFHDLDGGLLQVVAELRRSTVTLQSNTVTFLKENLSTFRVTGLYQMESELSQYPHWLRVEPFVEGGLGLSGTEIPFAVGGVDTNYHQQAGRIAGDFTAHFKEASSATPIFELPSFGGSDVLRGFRTDDAIGRRYLTLQSELWLPIPGLPAQPAAGAQRGGLASILSKLRLAPFADVGGAWQTLASLPAVREGAGLGLRLDMTAGMNHVVFRLDWAYGFGAAATGGSRGKFYFSLVNTLPF